MKKLFLPIFVLACLIAQAQTADDVILKYTTNMGGLEAFNKIQTIKLTGIATTQGMDLPLTVQIINGKAMRSDVEAMGKSVIKVYNDGKGWKLNPFAGVTTPTEVTGTELAEFKPQAHVANILMDYKSRGHLAELQGEADVNGIKAFRIKLTGKEDNKVTTYYISTADYSLLKSVTNADMQGQEIEVETFYSDIKEFNGLKFSMTRKNMIQGEEFQTVKYNTVELNVPVDDKIFEFPK